MVNEPGRKISISVTIVRAIDRIAKYVVFTDIAMQHSSMAIKETTN